MVIFKCIVIVCDLQVVRKNSDYIWKEQTKLNLAPLFVSHFVFLYEYIVIKSKHFTIKICVTFGRLTFGRLTFAEFQLDLTYFGQPYLQNYSSENFQILTRSVFGAQLQKTLNEPYAKKIQFGSYNGKSAKWFVLPAGFISLPAMAARCGPVTSWTAWNTSREPRPLCWTICS